MSPEPMKQRAFDHTHPPRKPHKKSRGGCINCRFRRVKCDERKPTCKRCSSYFVPCSYGRGEADLKTHAEHVSEGMIVLQHNVSSSTSEEPPSDNPWSSIRRCDLSTTLSVDPQHGLLLKFRSQTAWTLGSPESAHLYVEAVPRLALEHNYLLHTVLASVLLHDRSLAESKEPTSKECYHLSKAANLFSKKLSGYVASSDRDAIWATAVYLCALSIFNVTTNDPVQAWPLEPSGTGDLEWVQLQAGLQVMWQLAQLDSDAGAFSCTKQQPKANCVYPDVPPQGVEGIPRALIQLCDLDHTSTHINSPYHSAASHLAALLPVPGCPANMLNFLVFIGGLSQTFRDLLRLKDPRALLLMAIWYSKLFHASWWMIPRARLECRSIYLYLKQRHYDQEPFREIMNAVGQASRTFDTELVPSLLTRQSQQAHSQNFHLDPKPMDRPTSITMDLDWV